MSLIKAYEEGFQAFIDGDKKTSNPYPLHSESWERWNRGWATANFGSGIKQ
jgi:ribosome modulation factor